MEAVTVRECPWACGPPMVMKIGFSGGKLTESRNGRGPNRSGCVEAVREYDPERAS